MTRLFAQKGSKDDLPGLKKPSVPAIPDCFVGVSINTELEHCVAQCCVSVMPLFTSIIGANVSHHVIPLDVAL